MNRVSFGIVAGLVLGVLDVLLMLPLEFPDKRTALLAAFSSRFAIGFFASVSSLPLHPLAAGAIIGLLISLPDALVTKAYVPILITGLIFGAAACWAANRWAL